MGTGAWAKREPAEPEPAGVAVMAASQSAAGTRAAAGAKCASSAVSSLAASAAKAGQDVDTLRAAREAAIPARRFGNAEEFGAICAFLCSVQAAYVTGQNVLADGGAYPGTF